MQKQISVVLDNNDEFTFHVHDGVPLAHDAARAWLDHQFVALECEPLRASGKVLTADKILVVTQAAGPTLFGDAKWAVSYTHLDVYKRQLLIHPAFPAGTTGFLQSH